MKNSRISLIFPDKQFRSRKLKHLLFCFAHQLSVNRIHNTEEPSLACAEIHFWRKIFEYKGKYMTEVTELVHHRRFVFLVDPTVMPQVLHWNLDFGLYTATRMARRNLIRHQKQEKVSHFESIVECVESFVFRKFYKQWKFPMTEQQFPNDYNIPNKSCTWRMIVLEKNWSSKNPHVKLIYASTSNNTPEGQQGTFFETF